MSNRECPNKALKTRVEKDSDDSRPFYSLPSGMKWWHYGEGRCFTTQKRTQGMLGGDPGRRAEFPTVSLAATSPDWVGIERRDFRSQTGRSPN